MSGDESSDLGTASQAFLEHLEKTGFFQQINELEKNLKSIADDIKILGDATIQRMQETESLVAHVLACARDQPRADGKGIQRRDGYGSPT